MGDEEIELSRERSREMKTRSHRTYILRFGKSRQIEVSRGVELGVEDLAVDRYRCRENVKVQKHQTQEMRLDRSTRC